MQDCKGEKIVSRIVFQQRVRLSLHCQFVQMGYKGFVANLTSPNLRWFFEIALDLLCLCSVATDEFFCSEFSDSLSETAESKQCNSRSDSEFAVCAAQFL